MNNERKTNYEKGYHRKQYQLLFSMLSITYNSILRGTTVVLCFSSNWLGWKIQQDIMRSDMPKCCWWWKAWGFQECFKKCRAASRLDEPYIHDKHKKSNLSDCCQPPHVLYWTADPYFTKDKQSHSGVYCSPFSSKYEGNETSHYSFMPALQPHLCFYNLCTLTLFWS